MSKRKRRTFTAEEKAQGVRFVKELGNAAGAAGDQSGRGLRCGAWVAALHAGMRQLQAGSVERDAGGRRDAGKHVGGCCVVGSASDAAIYEKWG